MKIFMKNLINDCLFFNWILNFLKINRVFISKKIEYTEVFSVDGNIISKLVCLIYLLDYASIYFAVLSKIDPSPVDAIDFIKKRMWWQMLVENIIKLKDGDCMWL